MAKGIDITADDFAKIRFEDYPTLPQVQQPPAGAAGGAVALAPGEFESIKFDDPSPPAAPEKPGKLASFARGVAQGATLGFADEIAGLAEAAVTDKTYSQARDESRANFKAAEEANPKSYLAGNIGGGLATAAVPFLNVAKGATVAATAGKAALTGAAAGLGSSESDLMKGEVGGAAWDTAKGAVIGGALGYGGAKVASAFKNAGARVDKRLMDDLGEGVPRGLREELLAQTGATNAKQATERAVGVIRNYGLDKAARDPSTLGDAAQAGAAKAAAAAKAAESALEEKVGGASAKEVERALLKVRDRLGPGADKEAKRLTKAIERVREQWLPDEELKGADLLAVITKGAAGKQRERLGAKADRALELVNEYGLNKIASKPKELHAATRAAVEDTGQKIGAIYEAVDDAAPGVPLTRIAVALRKVADKYDSNPATKNLAQLIRRQIDDVVETWKGYPAVKQVPMVPAREVQKFATELGAQGFSGSLLDPKTATGMRRQVWGTVRDVLDDHVEAVAKRNPSIKKRLGDLQDLNERYSVLRDLDKVAARRANAAQTTAAAPAAAGAEKTGLVPLSAIEELAAGIQPITRNVKKAHTVVADTPLAKAAAAVRSVRDKAAEAADPALAKQLVAATDDKKVLEAIARIAQYRQTSEQFKKTGLRDVFAKEGSSLWSDVKGAAKGAVGAAVRPIDAALARLVAAAKAGNPKAIEALSKVYASGEQAAAANAPSAPGLALDGVASAAGGLLLPSSAPY